MLRSCVCATASVCRWLKGDWAFPAFPLSPSAEIKTSITKTPYCETQEEGTITDPADYAIAYKAMQYHGELPAGMC